MQKMSDAPLTICTACGEPTFSKQITAAGFQLKGSGWYATDFKNGSKGATKTGNTEKTTDGADTKTDTKTESKTDTKTESKTESKPAARTCGSGGCGACS
jgi:predicted nucleic acid-binding Zn ribbon protein